MGFADLDFFKQKKAPANNGGAFAIQQDKKAFYGSTVIVHPIIWIGLGAEGVGLTQAQHR